MTLEHPRRSLDTSVLGSLIHRYIYTECNYWYSNNSNANLIYREIIDIRYIV